MVSLIVVSEIKKWAQDFNGRRLSKKRKSLKRKGVCFSFKWGECYLAVIASRVMDGVAGVVEFWMSTGGWFRERINRIQSCKNGRRSRRAQLRLKDSWRMGGFEQPKGLRPRWQTYDRAARQFGVVIWPGALLSASRSDRVGGLPRYFVVNGVPFSPYR